MRCSVHAAALAALLALSSAGAAAEPIAVGDVAIENLYARPSIAGRPSAAYGAFTSTGGADRLIRASSPAFETVELHTHLMDGGVMRMRQVDAIEIGAGEAVELKPGGLHIMLIRPIGRAAVGDRFPLTLTFETAGDVTVEVEVREIAPAGHGGHDGHSGHGSTN